MADVMTLKVEGMTCGHCKATVEKAVGGLEGVFSAKVNLDEKTVQVNYEPAQVSFDQIKEAIEEEGYDVVGQAS